MDRTCFFCEGEVGSPFPVGDGSEAACGACVASIVANAAAARRRIRELLETRPLPPSVVRVAEIDGQPMLVREYVKPPGAQYDSMVDEARRMRDG